MSETNRTLKREVNQALAWLVALPILGTWPFVSAFPLFAVAAGPVDPLTISLNIALLVTGFWGIAALFVLRWCLMPSASGNKTPASRRATVVFYLTGYAVLWMLAYAAAKSVV